MTPTIYSPGDFAFNRLGELQGPLEASGNSAFPLQFSTRTFTQIGQQWLGTVTTQDLIEKWDGKFKAGDVVMRQPGGKQRTVKSVHNARWLMLEPGGSDDASLYRLISRPVENLLINQVEKPFRIEAGKCYATADGRKAGPIEQSALNNRWIWLGPIGEGTVYLWDANGKNYNEHALDLVSEWQDPIPDPVPAETASIFTPSFLAYLGKRFLDLPADEQSEIVTSFEASR